MSLEARNAAQCMVKSQLEARGIQDRSVLEAMRDVPRHLFVPEVTIEQAYSDRALPTTSGQTISQPYIVAKMTELLAVQPGMKVLEVGTGSGYQTAVLIRLGAIIVTIDRSEELAARAQIVLEQVCPGAPIQQVLGDGTLGWPEGAPYDRILVTAAAPHTPKAYQQQLAAPGRVVLPLGDRDSQILTVLDREGGTWRQTDDIPCRFVPLVGEDGWSA